MNRFTRALVFITISISFAAHARILKATASPVASAHGMLAFSEDEVWLADTYRVHGDVSRIYDLKGKAIATAPSGVGMVGISKHPVQDLFAFCDIGASNVSLRDSKGTEQAHFSIAKPWNARWSPSGHSLFVVTYAGSVFQVKRSQAIEILSGLEGPFDIAPVDDTHFWVSEQGGIDSSGKKTKNGRVCLHELKGGTASSTLCTSGSNFINPEGLAALPDGGVLVADTQSGTLSKVSADGKAVVIEKNLGIPIDLQLLSTGQWVVFVNRSSVGAAVVVGDFL